MYKFMNEEEIKIGQISDLKMLHLYQLGGCDALAVYYGTNEQINLCAMDPYYDLLMKKVLTLYSQCEDKNSIIADVSTRELLNKALERNNNHTSFFNRTRQKYLNMEGSSASKFASDGVMRESLIPMLKYYLKQLYHMWDMTVSFENEPYGWHRNCVLKVKISDETLVLPVKITFVNGNECKIIIGNFIHELNPIEFDISYREDKIYILLESKDIGLFGESHFAITAGKANAFTTIRVAGQVVYHQDEPLEIIPNSEDIKLILDRQKILTDIETDLTPAITYKLPWGGFVIFNTINTADEKLRRNDYDIIYIEEYRNKLALRQYSYSLIENITDGLKLRTDGVVMRKLYYGDRKQEVETYFMPAGYYSGWDYKEYLEGKFFYHEMEGAK